MEKYSIIMDKKDNKILDLLELDSGLTTSKISKKTNIPITTVHNRIQKMKKEGVIKNFTVNINYEKIGKPLTAYILVAVNQNLSGDISQQDIGKKIQMYDDVQNVDIVTGTTDLLIKVRIKSMRELSNLITNSFRKIKGVDKTQTMMVLESLDS